MFGNARYGFVHVLTNELLATYVYAKQVNNQAGMADQDWNNKDAYTFLSLKRLAPQIENHPAI